MLWVYIVILFLFYANNSYNWSTWTSAEMAVTGRNSRPILLGWVWLAWVQFYTILLVFGHWNNKKTVCEAMCTYALKIFYDGNMGGGYIVYLKSTCNSYLHLITVYKDVDLKANVCAVFLNVSRYLPALSLRVCSNIRTSALTSSLTTGGSARGGLWQPGSGVPVLLDTPCWVSCHILCHISACKCSQTKHILETSLFPCQTNPPHCMHCSAMFYLMLHKEGQIIQPCLEAENKQVMNLLANALAFSFVWL